MSDGIHSTTGLDYEIVLNDGEWQVWTPDLTGACIGSGATTIEAMESAILTMKNTCDQMTAAL